MCVAAQIFAGFMCPPRGQLAGFMCLLRGNFGYKKEQYLYRSVFIIDVFDRLLLGALYDFDGLYFALRKFKPPC